MRRSALVLLAITLVGWGVVGALEACGGDTEPLPPADGGEAGSEGSSGGTSGNSSGGTSGSSGADASSSGGETATPNPGKISCGASECDAGGLAIGRRVCCVRDAGPVCSTANDCDEDGDIRLECDEPGDCMGGRACCLRTGRDVRAECGGPGGGCGPGPGGVRLCKTTADCGDAGACNPKTCRGLRVHVCGDPEACD